MTTRIEADATKYPVLLSNGNLVDSGSLDGGKCVLLQFCCDVCMPWLSLRNWLLSQPGLLPGSAPSHSRASATRIRTVPGMEVVREEGAGMLQA